MLSDGGVGLGSSKTGLKRAGFLKDLSLECLNSNNCLAKNYQKDGQFDVVRSFLVKDKLDL
jgi:hypothetical protein